MLKIKVNKHIIMSRSLLHKIQTIFLVLLFQTCFFLKAEPTNTDTTHIIIIGFDGWDSASFDKVEMPFLKSKLPESAWTLNKRSILPSSSACNWATMFKGVGPEAHGYTEGDTKRPIFLVTEKNKKGFFPSLFSVFREVHPEAEMGYLYQWDGMRYLFDMDDFSFVYQFPDSEAGSDQMSAAAVSYILKSKPDLAAFIWDYPDIIGHLEGWGTHLYIKEMKHLDTIIESIVNACIEAEIYEDTLFVIVSDHGGHDKTHGQAIITDLESPFILFGPGIIPGEIVDPIMQYDVTAILADYLHLFHPSAWRGRTPDGIINQRVPTK